MNFKKVVQALSLISFFTLLLLAARPLIPWLPTDLFLRLDPLVFAGTLLASQEWVATLFPAVLILVSTLILGRFFCGYLCPMGITLDITDRLFTPSRSRLRDWVQNQARHLRNIKFWILLFILGTGLVGVSSVFLGAPLSLITRFYGLALYPFGVHAWDLKLEALFPAYLSLGWDSLAYAEVQIYRFATQGFVLLFFLVIFALVLLTPRFWCRYLCPSGAILALFSRKPLLRRKVSQACTQCGQCQRHCPMEAIPEDPGQTRHQECMVCQECVRICPEGAISFGFSSEKTVRQEFWPQRRKAVASVLAGVGAALFLQTGIREVRGDVVPGNVSPRFLIRPPGARVEEDFLSRCIRCGKCMKACPTNTLQPVWFESGILGLFSPKILPRRGPCEPLCNVCGQVCPTGAIRELPVHEKTWARMGTAVVLREKCLAWAWDRKCLVCFEVCPYAALELRRVPEIPVPVPFVLLDKCAGCGTCEFHCPVQAQSAIVVEPMHALRMNHGSYIREGKAQGMELDADPEREREPPEEIMPDREEPDELPPGFSPS